MHVMGRAAQSQDEAVAGAKNEREERTDAGAVGIRCIRQIKHVVTRQPGLVEAHLRIFLVP